MSRILIIGGGAAGMLWKYPVPPLHLKLHTRFLKKIHRILICKAVKRAVEKLFIGTHACEQRIRISYASTGSTGDGYRFAEKLGHKVTQRRPALGIPLSEIITGISLAGKSPDTAFLKALFLCVPEICTRISDTDY